MRFVYGPIPSRRLGRSLGVDPIPLKTCNWNCIYCQLGRSRPLLHERAEYAPQQEILDEILAAVANHVAGEIDYITFAGSGEPTLHSGLGWLIRRIQEQTAIPVAVITNGALLYLPEVRADLLTADVVMPTLSAGTAELYQRIHRPHPEATFERLVAGIAAFRAVYRGQLWLEVMLLGGLNDEEGALRDLAAVLQQLQPDQVHLVLPERPPAEPWVRPPDAEGMVRVVAMLGSGAHVVHALPVDVDARDYATPGDAIVSIVTRHPMSRAQLHQALQRWPPAEVDDALILLCEKHEIYSVERLGTEFWVAEGAHFPG